MAITQRFRTAKHLTSPVAFRAMAVGILLVLTARGRNAASEFAWGAESDGFSVGIRFDSSSYERGKPVTGTLILRTSKRRNDKILAHGLSDYGFNIVPVGSETPLKTTMGYDFSGPLERIAKVLEPGTPVRSHFDLLQFFTMPPGRYSVQVDRSIQYLRDGDAGPLIADPESPVVFITIL